MFVLHIYNVGQNMPNFTGRNYFPASQNLFGVQTFSPLSFDQFSYLPNFNYSYGFGNNPYNSSYGFYGGGLIPGYAQNYINFWNNIAYQAFSLPYYYSNRFGSNPFSYGFGNPSRYSNGPSNLDQILNHIEQSYNFGYNFYNYNFYNYNYNSATQPTYLDCIFNNMRQNPFIYNFINSENSNSEIDRALYPIDLFLNQRGLNVRFSNYGLYSSSYYSPTDCATRNILNLLDRSCQDSSQTIKNSRNSKNSRNKNLALA